MEYGLIGAKLGHSYSKIIHEMLCGYHYDLCPLPTEEEARAFLAKRQFKAIAIVGGRKGQEPCELCAPCGVCRQVMAEFCGPEFEIVMTDGKELQVKKLEDLLPLAFGPGNLQ